MCAFIYGLNDTDEHVRKESADQIRKQVKTPIMLDESLCGMVDAERALAGGWCDLFNLRLSKCGGFIPSLRLAQFARQHGLCYQLGCQVGETAVLSSAGRHFAQAREQRERIHVPGAEGTRVLDHERLARLLEQVHGDVGIVLEEADPAQSFHGDAAGGKVRNAAAGELNSHVGDVAKIPRQQELTLLNTRRGHVQPAAESRRTRATGCRRTPVDRGT
jgi:hypothetical protein